jgi:hypothetical protein
VLRIEIPDGGVRIEGDATDLLALAMWLRIAVEQGVAAASYASGDREVQFEIRCTKPMGLE